MSLNEINNSIQCAHFHIVDLGCCVVKLKHNNQLHCQSSENIDHDQHVWIVSHFLIGFIKLYLPSKHSHLSDPWLVWL